MDWMANPIAVIQSIFETHQADGCKEKILQYFDEKFVDTSILQKIPSLNDVPLHTLKSNSLVRFRCMIQDMFDPEYYLESCEAKDGVNGPTKMVCGMFRDIVDDGIEVDFSSSKNITGDRLLFYCISIPAENAWVKQAYAEKYCSGTFIQSSSSPSTSTQKRGFSDELMENGSERYPCASDMETDGSTSAETASYKRPKNAKQNSASSAAPALNALTDLNLPVPDPDAIACIVKVYDRGESFSLNDVVEFIGILTMEPGIVVFPDEEQINVDLDSMDVEERLCHSPPSSLVPRLHALKGFKLKLGNPHLPMMIGLDATHPDVTQLLAECGEIRAHLHSILEQAFWGDSLVGDYLICHLISTVYGRKDNMALGKLSLNLTNMFDLNEFGKEFYNLIGTLTVKSYFLPLTIANLNGTNITPVKDYSKNRLQSGLLQLSAHTHLVVDETALEPGQLDSKGVKNITALGNLMRWQKVEYNFNYHHLDFVADIPVLIMSNGQSLLPADCMLPVESRGPPQGIAQIFVGINNYLTPVLKAKIRSYLSLLQMIDYDISKDLQKVVQDDFVEQRKQPSAKINSDDLHLLLVLARLISLSYGQAILTSSSWEKAKKMESERKARILSPR